MIAPETLLQARAQGLVLRPCGENLAVSPRDSLSPELRSAILADKREILEFLHDEAPDPDRLRPRLKEEYEERAAIMEILGELPRVEAERRAWWMVVAKECRNGAPGSEGGAA